MKTPAYFSRKVIFASIILLASSLSFAKVSVAPTHTVGEGSFEYRFVLRGGPQARVLPNHRYRLFVKDEPIVGVTEKNKGVLFGITDAQGRTARVRMMKSTPTDQWVLSPVVGDGEFGESFVLKFSTDHREFGGYHYLINLQDSFLYCGTTPKDSGTTTYVRSSAPINVELIDFNQASKADWEWCNKASELLSKFDGPHQPMRQFKTLLSLPIPRPESKLFQIYFSKLVSASANIGDGSSAYQVIEHFDKTKPTASHLNSVGFELVEKGQLAVGSKLLQRAHELDPLDPYILDSWGWVLFKQGQMSAALEEISQSAKKMHEQGIAHGPLIEVLTHLGEVQLSLGHHDEAQLAWSEAYSLQPDNPQLLETLERFQIKPKDLPAFEAPQSEDDDAIEIKRPAVKPR